MPQWLALLVALFAAAFVAPPVRPAGNLDKISHILIIYLENHSFDNLFGEFPGANGIAQAGTAAIQRDALGRALDTLPAVKVPFDWPENPASLRSIPKLDGL